MFPASSHVIRLAGDADYDALERLARLDTASPLEHPIVVGEISGRVVAAIDLDERRTIANPFEPDRSAAGAAAGPCGRLRRARTPGVADRIRAALGRNRLAYG